ncbi:MAG: DUF447 domain-containing protein [Halanaerobium sp.]
MIIETVITTQTNADKINFAALGVEFFEEKLVFYAYKDTATAENIKNSRKGVVNLVDRAKFIVFSALSDQKFKLKKTADLSGYFLEECCHYYEFKVLLVEDLGEKYRVTAEITADKFIKEASTFNRANNLLLEAAVIASRIGISFDKKDLLNYLDKNKRIIFKTGDNESKKVFNFLVEYAEKQEVKNID